MLKEMKSVFVVMMMTLAAIVIIISDNPDVGFVGNAKATTTNVTAETTDGWITSESVVSYAVARAGSEFLFVDTTTNITVAQVLAPLPPPPTWIIYRGAVEFDTSSIPDADIITSANIWFNWASDDSTTNFAINIRAVNYSTLTASTSDWTAMIGGVSMGTLVNTSSFVANSWVRLNMSVGLGSINRTGMSQYSVVSWKDVNATAPTTLDVVRFWAADWPLYDPFLVVTHNPDPAQHIEILNPRDSQSIQDHVDFVSKVDVPSGWVLNEVTFQINSVWYPAIWHAGTQTYRHLGYNTKQLTNGYYTLTARVNFTNNEFGTDSIQAYIDNHEGRGCTYDNDKRIWRCGDTNYFTPNPWEAQTGVPEVTKASDDTVWNLYYTYSESSSGTSNAYYRPFQNATYTDFVIWKDEFYLDGYDYSTRTYINDTASTAATGDDTELNNDTYVTYWRGDGAQNVTVEGSVSMDVVRYSEITIRSTFTWSENIQTGRWSYSWSHRNNLQATMAKMVLWIPFKDTAQLDTVRVNDATTELNPGKDYLLYDTGVSIGIDSLTSGSTSSITVSYDKDTGDHDLTLTITITDGDLSKEQQLKSGKEWTLATKQVYNGNTYNIVGGRLIVYWQIDTTPDTNYMIIEDDAGSNYNFYFDSATQLTVQDVSLDVAEHKTFYFYFDAIKEKAIIDWAWFLSPIIALFLIIISTMAGISLTLERVKKQPLHPDTRKYIVGVGLGSFFIALMLIFMRYVIPYLP